MQLSSLMFFLSIVSTALNRTTYQIIFMLICLFAAIEKKQQQQQC